MLAFLAYEATYLEQTREKEDVTSGEDERVFYVLSIHQMQFPVDGAHSRDIPDGTKGGGKGRRSKISRLNYK